MITDRSYHADGIFPFVQQKHQFLVEYCCPELPPVRRVVLQTLVWLCQQWMIIAYSNIGSIYLIHFTGTTKKQKQLNYLFTYCFSESLTLEKPSLGRYL